MATFCTVHAGKVIKYTKINFCTYIKTVLQTQQELLIIKDTVVKPSQRSAIEHIPVPVPR